MQLSAIAQACLIGVLALSGQAANAVDDSAMEQARQHIAEQAKALEPTLLETRRDIHAHPELGNTESAPHSW